MLSTVLIVFLMLVLIGGFYPWSGPGAPPVAPGQEPPIMDPVFYSGYGHGARVGLPALALLIILAILVLADVI